MQPIITRYYGPTNTKPSRIVARAGGESVTMSPSDSRTMFHQDVHAAAAQAVAKKLGWKGEWVGSQLDRYWVWIPTDDRNHDRFTA